MSLSEDRAVHATTIENHLLFNSQDILHLSHSMEEGQSAILYIIVMLAYKLCKDEGPNLCLLL